MTGLAGLTHEMNGLEPWLIVASRRLWVCAGPMVPWTCRPDPEILLSCVSVENRCVVPEAWFGSVWGKGIGWVGVGRWGDGMRYGIILGCVSVVGGFLMGMLYVRGVVVVVVVDGGCMDMGLGLVLLEAHVDGWVMERWFEIGCCLLDRRARER